MHLYGSGRFRMIGCRVAGKKDIAGILYFKGLPSGSGSPNEIFALRDGIVIESGRVFDNHRRISRSGTHVTLLLPDGTTMTYGRLSGRAVSVGDSVRAGDLIGYEGDTGSGRGFYLSLEIRRNGRRIDGCNFLKIPRDPQEFSESDRSAPDIVSKICHLDEKTRSHLDNAPDPTRLWQTLLEHLNIS